MGEKLLLVADNLYVAIWKKEGVRSYLMFSSLFFNLSEQIFLVEGKELVCYFSVCNKFLLLHLLSTAINMQLYVKQKNGGWKHNEFFSHAQSSL